MFRLFPPAAGSGAWTSQQLYAFQGTNDGRNPSSGLIADNLGNLYGTTLGSTPGYGTAYELLRLGNGLLGPWPLTVLYAFQGSDGANPEGGLILSQSFLYGTTLNGGNTNNGTVFQIYIPPVPPPLHQCSGEYWCQRLNKCVSLPVFRKECLYSPITHPMPGPTR